MFASQQRHTRRYARYLIAAGLSLAGPAVFAAEQPAAPECSQDAVVAHVQEQFRIYGPRSKDREYFGFIYRRDGEIDSAVVEGKTCGENYQCEVETAPAAARIPPGAKVLGEWHTHPHHQGSRNLSADDVRGAHHNRKIRCYTAYYSSPDGEFYSWIADSTSVPIAMSSRARLGNYRHRDAADERVASAKAVTPEAPDRKPAPVPL